MTDDYLRPHEIEERVRIAAAHAARAAAHSGAWHETAADSWCAWQRDETLSRSIGRLRGCEYRRLFRLWRTIFEATLNAAEVDRG